MSAPVPAIDKYTGNPSELSYVPLMGTVATQPMGFLKRTENALKSLLFEFIFVVFDYKLTRIYNDVFPEQDMPTLKELRKNISMAFVGSHLISEGPIRPLVPALIEIGGIQVKDKPSY